MTIFRAPLANFKGEVMLSMQATGVVPAGAVPFRGLWVTINGLVCATNDTGQARKYVGGFALEDPSGLLLVTETAPASVPMDGINANAAGAVVTKEGAASLIHQGVAMTVSAPGGPLVVNKEEPPLTFYAGLERGVNSAGIDGNEERNSLATYQAEGSILRAAQIDEIRQEFKNGQALGTLMEPAGTNKCSNWNANPDDALTNLVFFGDAAAISGRSLDMDALVSANLDRICTSGYVIKIDNSAGVAAAYCRFVGQTGNTNEHVGSAYVRADVGEGVLEVSGGSQGQVNFTNTDYQRVGFKAAPSATDRELTLRAQAGAIVYCILNQWEEISVPTSVIVTQGTATPRAVDQLTWSLTDSLGRNILNQSQGICASVWRPNYGDGDLLTGQLQNGRTLRLGSGQGQLFGPGKRVTNENVFSTFDGTTTISVELTAPFVKDQDYVIAVRWTGATREIGYKTLGVWTWASGAYSGAWAESGILELHPFVGEIQLPTWHRMVYFWGEAASQAWIETFFSGVANS